MVLEFLLQRHLIILLGQRVLFGFGIKIAQTVKVARDGLVKRQHFLRGDEEHHAREAQQPGLGQAEFQGFVQNLMHCQPLPEKGQEIGQNIEVK